MKSNCISESDLLPFTDTTMIQKKKTQNKTEITPPKVGSVLAAQRVFSCFLVTEKHCTYKKETLQLNRLRVTGKIGHWPLISELRRLVAVL